MIVLSKKSLAVLFLLFVCSLGESTTPNQVDYFKLNLIWPNSFCNHGKTPCKESVPQDFKVHGFSSYKTNGTLRRRFTSDDLSTNEIRNWNFTRNLSSVWPNLIRGRKNIRLWKWEWQHYGVYSGMTAENYFYLVVRYTEKYKHMFKSLLKSGITPSDQPYEQEVLLDEITKVVGSLPAIQCSNFNKSKQLSYISICITKQGVSFDCPATSLVSSCGGPKELILFAKKDTVPTG